MNRASALLAMGRHAEAVAGYDEALPLSREHALPAELARCQANRANSLRAAGESNQAVLAYREIDLTAQPECDRQEFHIGFGEALWATGERDAALAQYELGLRSVRLARRVGGIDASSLEFLSERQGFIDTCVRRALEHGRSLDAFRFSQDGKATLYGDIRSAAGPSQSLEAELAPARKQLTDRLRAPRPEDVADEIWETAGREAREAFFRAWRVVNQRDRTSAQPAADVLVTLEEIQAELATGWAILDFWRVENERFAVFVITRDDFHVEYVDFPVSDEELKDGPIGLLFATQVPEAPRRTDVLFDLYGQLFQNPVAKLKAWGISGLYLVPHGILHSLPLHCSCYYDGQKRTRYLCDDFDVAYLPSSSLLPQLPPVSLNGRVFSLANPERGVRKMSLPFADWEGQQLRASSGKSAGSCRAATPPSPPPSNSSYTLHVILRFEPPRLTPAGRAGRSRPWPSSSRRRRR